MDKDLGFPRKSEGEETATIRRESGGITNLSLGIRAKRAIENYNQTRSGLSALSTFIFPDSMNYNGSTSGGFGWMSVAPRDFPYDKVNAYNSSIVMANVNWIAKSVQEAKPRVYKTNGDGAKQYLPNSLLQRLLRRPNAFYTFSKLMEATLISYYLDGNGYWFKERGDGGTGLTRALYYIPHYQIEPKAENGNFVSYYEYIVNGVTYRIPPERIIHFRNGMDIYNPLKGRKILHPVMSEVYTDEEAASFVSALVRNTAIPGVVIVPDTEKVTVGDQEALDLKENYKRKFGGDNRGEPLIANFAAKIEQIGFSPEQLQFKEVRRLPEERVCAQFGLPPQVAGLGAGLDNNTYSNYEEAEIHAFRSVCVPLWDDLGETLDLGLSGEFSGGDASQALEYDYSRVRALNESQDSIVNRAVKLYVVDGITRAELREDAGKTVDEARDNVFLSEIRAANAAARENSANGSNNGKKPQETDAKKILRDAETLIKALPPGDYDNALDMSQEAIVKAAINPFEDDLDKMFYDLGKEAERIVKETGADRGQPKEETERLLGQIIKAVGLFILLRGLWGKMGKAIESDTVETISLRLAVSVSDVWDGETDTTAKSVLAQQAAQYEKELIEQSRKAIEKAIRGAEVGDSAAKIAKEIRKEISGREMFPGVYKEAYEATKEAGGSDAEAERNGEAKARRARAKRIAETETRLYQNAVTLEGYAKTGLTQVKVFDGAECGWKKHTDTDKAEGSVRTITEAKKYRLAHPNCQRRFYPVDKKDDNSL